jgi:NIPSNAP protein
MLVCCGTLQMFDHARTSSQCSPVQPMLTYDVAVITVHPGRHPAALAHLERTLSAGAYPGQLLGCWYSEIGALNHILIIHAGVDEPARTDARAKIVQSKDAFGVGEHLVGMSMDTYVSLPFLRPMQGGQYGPIYEVRTYVVRPDGLAPTIELWRKCVPARQAVSPLLAAMYSVSGTVTRFMHLWPYTSLDERQRLRSKAVADGVWPPPGGPDHFISMQSDIFLPANFSPMK